jgi:hypothetical protein
MYLFPTSRHFISLPSKYSLQHPVLKHPQSCSSRNVRDKFSHPYKTASKIIVLYIFIFMFLDTRQQDRRFWITNITWIQCPLDFLLNQVLICYSYSEPLLPSLPTITQNPLMLKGRVKES